MEFGPFQVNDDQTLSLNPYSWNQFANIIFLESPGMFVRFSRLIRYIAGVGFSYTTVQSEYPTGDKITAGNAILPLFRLKHSK